MVARLEVLLERFNVVLRVHRKDVLRMTGWSDSTLRRRISQGLFPLPQTDPANGRPFWLISDLAQWTDRPDGQAGQG
jgi:predicted DNA-binding transcriptional regulator AlpA